MAEHAAKLIDGKTIAKYVSNLARGGSLSLLTPSFPRLSLSRRHLLRQIRDDLRTEIDLLKSQHPHFSPHLVIVQVGEREDSTIYVNMKKKAAEEVR